MATQLHVNGLATVLVNGETLGWTVDGVNIEFIAYFEDVYTDCAGPHIPYDVLCYGEEARVTCDMIVYDTTVMESVSTRIFNVDATLGTTPNGPCAGGVYGWLLSACGGTFELGIAQGSGCQNEPEGGWYFPTTYLMDNHSLKVGTRVTRHQMVFRCLPNGSGLLYSTASDY